MVIFSTDSRFFSNYLTDTFLTISFENIALIENLFKKIPIGILVFKRKRMFKKGHIKDKLKSCLEILKGVKCWYQNPFQRVFVK